MRQTVQKRHDDCVLFTEEGDEWDFELINEEQFKATTKLTEHLQVGSEILTPQISTHESVNYFTKLEDGFKFQPPQLSDCEPSIKQHQAESVRDKMARLTEELDLLEQEMLSLEDHKN